jgi:hypothetical protein
MRDFYSPLGTVLGPKLWPSSSIEKDENGLMRHLFVSLLEFDYDWDQKNLTINTSLFIDQEISLSIPGMDWLRLALSPTVGGIDLPIAITLNPFKITIKDLAIVASTTTTDY